MAAEGKEEKDPLLSPLLQEPDPERVYKLAERLGDKCPLFEDASIGSTAVNLLLGHHLSCVFKDFKSSHFPIVTTLSKQLLSHAFKLLPNCRSQYSLPLFRVLLCLCAPGEGEESVLCESDVSLLKNIVRNNLTSLEKLLQEKKQGASDVTVSDKTRATPPTEGGGGGGHYEVQRLLSQMKTGSKKPSPLHFEGPQQVKSPKEEFQGECVRHLKKMKGGMVLVEYCLKMTALLELREKKKEHIMSGTKAEQQDKLFHLKCAIDAVLVVSSLPSSLFLPLTGEMLSDFTRLVQDCINCSTTVLNCYNNILSTAAGRQKVAVQESSGEGSDGSEFAPSNIEELLKGMSVCQNIGNVKGNCCDVIIGTVRIVKRIESLIKESAKAKSYDVFATIVIFDLFSGLNPLILTNSSAKTAPGPISQAKFTIPLARLTLLGVQLTNDLLTLLSDQSEQEEEGSEGGVAPPTISSLDINGTYSRWQLVQLLLGGVSLVDVLLCVSHNSFKKVMILLDSGSSQEGSQTELSSNETFSILKPDISEKEKQLSRRLQDSLSSKISQAMASKGEEEEEEEEKEEEGEKSQSVSPVSTVSSSGVVQGEYVVNPEQQVNDGQEEEEEEEEEEVEEEVEENDEDFANYEVIRELLTPNNAPLALPPPLPPKRSKMSKPEVLTPSAPPLPPRGPKYFRMKVEGLEIKRKPLFYQSLSLLSLKCLLHGVVQNKSELLKKYLVGSVTPGQVSILAWLFLNVQNSCSESEGSNRLVSFREFSSVVPQVLHDLVQGEGVSLEHHAHLLRDLGLVPGCWPLFMIPSTLSILASVLVIRASKMKDDPLCVNIWKGFLTTLEENAGNENETEEDLPVTHLQLLLLVWGSFTEPVRKGLLLQCVGIVNKVAEEREQLFLCFAYARRDPPP